MGGRFDSGVSRYVAGSATVTNYFPVDFKGNADICCMQCRFYRRTSQRCSLNDRICEYPERYVGSHCPLTLDEGGNEPE